MIHVSVLCDRDTLNLHLYFLQMRIAVNLQSLNIHDLFELLYLLQITTEAPGMILNLLLA